MKRMVVEIENSLHKEIKLSALKQEKTIKQYVTDVLKEKIMQKNRTLAMDILERKSEKQGFGEPLLSWHLRLLSLTVFSERTVRQNERHKTETY